MDPQILLARRKIISSDAKQVDCTRVGSTDNGAVLTEGRRDEDEHHQLTRMTDNDAMKLTAQNTFGFTGSGGSMTSVTLLPGARMSWVLNSRRTARPDAKAPSW